MGLYNKYIFLVMLVPELLISQHTPHSAFSAIPSRENLLLIRLPQKEGANK